MIAGVGTDLVEIGRIRGAIERHGARFAERILAPQERDAYMRAADPARFLAKRFALKEAFGKALGIGVTAPATFHAVRLDHDRLGRPFLMFDDRLENHMTHHQLHAHVSISDEQSLVIAFVVVESRMVCS